MSGREVRSSACNPAVLLDPVLKHLSLLNLFDLQLLLLLEVFCKSELH